MLTEMKHQRVGWLGCLVLCTIFAVTINRYCDISIRCFHCQFIAVLLAVSLLYNCNVIAVHSVALFVY